MVMFATFIFSSAKVKQVSYGKRVVLFKGYEDRSEPYLYIKLQSVPRSKHSVSVIKTDQLMYSEIIAVCTHIYPKHINTLYGQNV